MFFVFLPWLFVVLKAASDFSLIILAYAAIKFLGLYGPQTVSLVERLKRAYRAF
jgi:ABC-type dipeptide/oligopeptide/nickel transport system permease subunit